MEKEPKLNELDKEKIKEATKERILSDAEFIKRGAEPVVDDEGNARLEITDRQIDGIKRDRDREIEKERRHLLYEHVQQQGFIVGDKIKVKFLAGLSDSELGWRYISPELTRYNIKTGDER